MEKRLKTSINDPRLSLWIASLAGDVVTPASQSTEVMPTGPTGTPWPFNIGDIVSTLRDIEGFHFCRV
jgi:hypothetical protein